MTGVEMGQEDKKKMLALILKSLYLFYNVILKNIWVLNFLKNNLRTASMLEKLLHDSSHLII